MSVFSSIHIRWKTSFIAILLALASVPAGAQMPPELPVEAFARLPQVMDPRLSPDGTYLSVIRPYKGKRHLFIQAIDGRDDPVVIPPSDEFEISWATWANNERLLVGISLQGWRWGVPTYETRLIGTNRDGSEKRSLAKRRPEKKTGTRLGKSDNIVPIQDRVIDLLRADAKHFLLAIDGNFDGSAELRRVDINSGEFVEIYDGMRGVQQWMTDQQGQVRFAGGVDTESRLGLGRTRNQKIYYRHADGPFGDFSENEVYQKGFRAWEFGLNPDYVYMGGYGENGRQVVIKYDLRAQKILKTYAHERFDAEGLLRDPASGVPIGVHFAGNAAPVIFDAEWERRYASINKSLSATENLVVSSNSARTLHLIYSASDTDSGVYYVYNEKTKHISQLALRYASLDPAQMAPMREVTYTSRDGLEIPAILTMPLGTNGKNLPTVVLPHGGPYARDDISFDYWVQFLTNRGYAVLQPNFRGSTGYGKEFLEAGYGQWGLKMQDDVTDGTNWLIEQGIADPARICIVGGSYGGYAALMGAAKEPDLYACAISANGVTDIEKLMVDAQRYIGGALATRHINQKNQRDVSPINRTKSIKAPVLLFATEDDRTVDYRQSKSMAKALKKAKVEYEYVEIEEGDHGLTTEAARERFLTETEAFLAKHIGRGR